MYYGAISFGTQAVLVHLLEVTKTQLYLLPASCQDLNSLGEIRIRAASATLWKVFLPLSWAGRISELIFQGCSQQWKQKQNPESILSSTADLWAFDTYML